MMSNLFTFKKMYILIKLLISECSISMVSMLLYVLLYVQNTIILYLRLVL